MSKLKKPMPFIKVSHRFGSVFVRMVIPNSVLGMTTHVLRYDVETADSLADQLRACAAGAKRHGMPRHVARHTLKIAKVRA